VPPSLGAIAARVSVGRPGGHRRRLRHRRREPLALRRGCLTELGAC
jgi:hypothetical protein